MAKEGRNVNLRIVSGNLRTIFTFKMIFFIFWACIINIPNFLLLVIKAFLPRKEKDILGKYVLITGTANGLGKAMALEFARQGSKVICVDINKTANDKTVEEINKMTGRSDSAKNFVCDVGDSEAVKKLAADVEKEYQNVDILINNAGLIYGEKILEEDDEMSKNVVKVNMMSSYWMVKSFLPRMKKRNVGHLVFINSMASLTPLSEGVIYTMTKYGLLGLSDTLMEEISQDPSCSNMKVTSVHPFFMNTDGLKAHRKAQGIVMMRVEDAAKKIICGIRREYSYFSVPGYATGYFLFSLVRIIPENIYRQLANKYREIFLVSENKEKSS